MENKTKIENIVLSFIFLCLSTIKWKPWKWFLTIYNFSSLSIYKHPFIVQSTCRSVFMQFSKLKLMNFRLQHFRHANENKQKEETSHEPFDVWWKCATFWNIYRRLTVDIDRDTYIHKVSDADRLASSRRQ